MRSLGYFEYGSVVVHNLTASKNAFFGVTNLSGAAWIYILPTTSTLKMPMHVDFGRKCPAKQASIHAEDAPSPSSQASQPSEASESALSPPDEAAE